MRIVADVIRFVLHPRQTPDADHFRAQRVADVERPDHAAVPARRVIGQKRKLTLQIDAETMRARSGHVVEADGLRRCRLRHIEDEKAGAGILAFVAGKPLGIHIKQIVADDAQLVTMHAGRGMEFADLFRTARIAHVMNGETFGTVEARPADGADISVAFMHLNQAAAAPRRRRIVAEQAEILGFFGVSGGHAWTSIFSQLGFAPQC